MKTDYLITFQRDTFPADRYEPKQTIVPTLSLDEAADKYGFRVPYNGTNDFYDHETIKHFKAGAEWQAKQQSVVMDSDKIDKEAVAYADSKERRACSYWNGLYHGYKAALLKK